MVRSVSVYFLIHVRGGIVLTTDEKRDLGIEFSSVVTDMVELKRCNRSEQSYKKHLHYELSIGIIREGTTTVKFPDKTISFTQGDGVIIPPKLSHMCSPEDIDQWRFDMLYINPDFYGSQLKFEHAVKVGELERGMIEDFLTMLEEENDHFYIEDQLIGLLVELAEDEDDSVSDLSKKSEVVCRKLKGYIDVHFSEKLSLDMLQELFEMDRFAMIRSFGKQYNTSPMSYQLQLKVAEAKRQLRLEKPLMDICYDLGFYDQAHFTKEFQKMNGLTPMAYQKSIQG